MTDVVEAVHPVPVLSRTRRGRHAGWDLVARRTPVVLPRIDPGEVTRLGAVRLDAADEAPLGLVGIEGRAFVEVGPRREGGSFRSLPDLMACEGGGYRNLQAGALLLGGTPASALILGLDRDLAPEGGIYEDRRGSDPAELGRREVVEDLAEACRDALLRFVARNVRLAGDSAYVDAGGPLLGRIPTDPGFAVRHAPRLFSGTSLVRLARADLGAYCDAIGTPVPRAVPAALPGIADRSGAEADLCFLNAAPGAMLSAGAHFLRRARREPGSVPHEAAAAFEALIRPAVLGTIGMVDPDDGAAVLEAVSRAASWYAEMPATRGMPREFAAACDAQVASLSRDLEAWALPRALAHDARFDEADAGFLPGPPAGR